MCHTRKLCSLVVRCKYILLLLVVCSSSFLLSMLFKSKELRILVNLNFDASKPKDHLKSEDKFTLRTQGCTIPFLYYLDKSIKKFVKYPNAMKPCHNPRFALLERNKSRITVKYENLLHYDIHNKASLICCYQAFYRPNYVRDISSYVDDRVKYKQCIQFTDSIELNDEFVRVKCYVRSKYNTFRQVFKQFFLSAPKKIFLKHFTADEIPASESTYNVLIIGIDGVSRLNLYRTMVKTVAYVKNYGGLDLSGFNKVGDNSFPNIVSSLLGFEESELQKICLPYEKATFDNCPFIWERFKQAGYYTALAEDSAYLGHFNYFKYGFRGTPTDYYIRTFVNEAENQVGHILDKNSFLCMNNYHFYQVLLDYIGNISNTLKDNRLFGFFWEVTMSHDHLNYPMVMDDSYVDLFTKLNESGYLNETIVFFMSDHGMRIGSIRSTKQGRLEESLPFMFIMAPPSFRKKYSKAYSNLKLNSKRLTTPFDVHETLLDLVELKKIENEVISKRTKEPYAHNRGISLFLPIPSNRTCKMAAIDDHWCTCHKEKALQKETSEALEAAAHLVRYLNVILREYSECARLSLAEVVSITELMEVNSPEANEKGWREFIVAVKTTPGNGIFEATLKKYKRKWTVAGMVSRLNTYGYQSHCMLDYHLKLYCYCYH